MANIKLRSSGSTGATNTSGNNNTFSGSQLSYSDVDLNFINLNDGKLDKSLNLSDIGATGTARTNLGLGTIATQNANNVSITGGTVGATMSGSYFSLASNTLTGTAAQFNAAVSDTDFVTLTGTETLTNKTLTNPSISGTTGPLVVGYGSTGIVTAKSAQSLKLVGSNNNIISPYIVLPPSGDITIYNYQSTANSVNFNGKIIGKNAVKSVKVATSANITLSGTQTIDSVVLSAGDLVLVKNQTTATENGIYTVSSSSWTRHGYFNTNVYVSGAIVAVEQGTTNGGTLWTTDFLATDTLDTTAMNWYQLVYTAGATQALSNKTVSLASGTTTTSPLKFTAGTSLTSPIAGAVEYDGTIIYATPTTSIGRVTVATPIFCSGANGSLSGTANADNPLFTSSTDTITLPVGTYKIELCMLATANTGGNATYLSLNLRGGSGGATGVFSWNGSATDNNSLLNWSNGTVRMNQVAATSLGSTFQITDARSGTTSYWYTTGTGILKVTTAGTITPSFRFSATVTNPSLSSDNYLIITPMSSSGITTSTGAWS